MEIPRYRSLFCRPAAALFLLATGAVYGVEPQNAALGDINFDGGIDVLDVQAGISQALGNSTPTPEGDIDESMDVNVLDIQHLINTALGVGGLAQRVHGVVDCNCDAESLRIVAISNDGRRRRALVDPDTGEFHLVLRARASWALALCGRVMGSDGLEERCFATFEFPIGGDISATLPLPTLSPGEILDLGVLIRVGDRLRSTTEIRRLLSTLAQPLDVGDQNENGVPDFVEPLLRLVESVDGIPADLRIGLLLERTGDCAADAPAPDSRPDLRDENGNRVPDFLEPYLLCFRGALRQTLSDAPIISDAITVDRAVLELIDDIMSHLVRGIPEWLRSLQRPLLIDDDENGIPDIIQELLSTSLFPGAVDRDGDGVPDFAQDHDGDGIPNIEDEDWRQRIDEPGIDGNPNDIDGDGIPNDEDVDDDNDGIPDYADDTTEVLVEKIPVSS